MEKKFFFNHYHPIGIQIPALNTTSVGSFMITDHAFFYHSLTTRPVLGDLLGPPTLRSLLPLLVSTSCSWKRHAAADRQVTCSSYSRMRFRLWTHSPFLRSTLLLASPSPSPAPLRFYVYPRLHPCLQVAPVRITTQASTRTTSPPYTLTFIAISLRSKIALHSSHTIVTRRHPHPRTRILSLSNTHGCCTLVGECSSFATSLRPHHPSTVHSLSHAAVAVVSGVWWWWRW